MPDRWYYPDDSPYLLWLDRPPVDLSQEFSVLETTSHFTVLFSFARVLRPRKTTSPLTVLSTEAALTPTADE